MDAEECSTECEAGADDKYEKDQDGDPILLFTSRLLGKAREFFARILRRSVNPRDAYHPGTAFIGGLRCDRGRSRAEGRGDRRSAVIRPALQYGCDLLSVFTVAGRAAITEVEGALMLWAIACRFHPPLRGNKLIAHAVAILLL